MLDRIARTLAAAWEAWTGKPGGVYTLKVEVEDEGALARLEELHTLLGACVVRSQILAHALAEQDEETGLETELLFAVDDDDHGLN